MAKNKLVVQVPPDYLWSAVDIDKIRKTHWEVNSGSDKVTRRISTVPIFGTREMWKVVTPGDFLVFIESSIDDLHTYAWNLHVMSEAFYRKWEANE